jgi:hypothetical protein
MAEMESRFEGFRGSTLRHINLRPVWQEDCSVFWSDNYISCFQVQWAVESISAVTGRQLLSTAAADDPMRARLARETATASVLDRETVLRAGPLYMGPLTGRGHFGWAAQHMGVIYYGDTLRDDVRPDTWVCLYDLFGISSAASMRVEKVAMQRQTESVCGIYTAACLYLLALGMMTPLALGEVSFDETQLFTWFASCAQRNRAILVPPQEGVEFTRAAPLRSTRGGPQRIHKKPTSS